MRLRYKGCRHDELVTTLSSHATDVGFQQQSIEKRARAAGLEGKLEEDPDTFPAPLVLPGDDLALFSGYSAQTVRSWKQIRNDISDERRTIYIVHPPSCSPEAQDMLKWILPTFYGKKKSAIGLSQPDAQHIRDYVAAFYHGMPVKLLPSTTFCFEPWETDPNQKKVAEYKESGLIGLNTGKEIVGIRTRKALDKSFSHQLNLTDLIDAMMSALPKDAYAMVLLVDHDLYEDDDDEFVCGRAYGGSRVSLVSSARYNPAFDTKIGMDTVHSWPNSHCSAFINKLVVANSGVEVDRSVSISETSASSSSKPLHAASQAAIEFHHASPPPATADVGLWLGRMCRTVSHELGHCFGMDHCTYYACCMQGSASLLEDVRQPPYLCPVDLAKVLNTTAATEEEHYRAMLEFCEEHLDVELFVAYRAWLQAMMMRFESHTM